MDAAAAIAEATGIPVRYEQSTDGEAAAIRMRTLTDWLSESGAAAIRTQLTAR